MVARAKFEMVTTVANKYAIGYAVGDLHNQLNEDDMRVSGMTLSLRDLDEGEEQGQLDADRSRRIRDCIRLSAALTVPEAMHLGVLRERSGSKEVGGDVLVSAA